MPRWEEGETLSSPGTDQDGGTRDYLSIGSVPRLGSGPGHAKKHRDDLEVSERTTGMATGCCVASPSLTEPVQA